MTEKYTSAAGREGKLKNEIEQMEAHIHILVTLANKVTREFTHPLAKHEITRQYKEIGKTLGVENAPGNYIENFSQGNAERVYQPRRSAYSKSLKGKKPDLLRFATLNLSPL